jgi:hypothetical protein
MNVNSVAVVLPALSGPAAAMLTAWLRSPRRRQACSGGACRHGGLPAGSRVIDLGRHGVIVDVGARGNEAGNAGQ